MRSNHQSPGQLTLGLSDDPTAILRALCRQLVLAEPLAMLVPEFGVWQGRGRIDLAQVHDALRGWEIKAGRDDLRRLPSQSVLFSDVFDYVTLVTAERHMATALSHVPEWWGLSAVVGNAIIEVRPPIRNQSPSPLAVAGLLWRDEASSMLAELTGIRSRGPRRRLVADLAGNVDPIVLATSVRRVLRQRSAWRPAA